MGLRLFLATLIVMLAGAHALALEPDEILLVANGNAKESREFAAYYAKVRNVPAGNIVLLDLRGGEEISRTDYVERIAKPVREWLSRNDPDNRIKCLLTFYGVPLRVGAKRITPEEEQELKAVREELKETRARIGPLVRDLEDLVQSLDSAFKPPTTQTSLPAHAARLDHAVKHLVQKLNTEPDPAVRRRALERLFVGLDDLTGPSGLLNRAMFTDLPATAGPATRAVSTTLPTTVPATQPAGGAAPIQPVTAAAAPPPATGPAAGEADDAPPDRRELVAAARARSRWAAETLAELARRSDEPDARRQMRDFARAEMGLVTYARVLENHVERLQTSETNAAVDNELALVKWGDHYTLYRWIDNPLYFRHRPRPGMPPVIMVMRLDGRDLSVVNGILKTSLAAEQEGLGGKLVIDSRGISPKKADGGIDAYGEYDQRLRDLASLVRARSDMPVVLDEQPAVLPNKSVKDVGLYVGWYALRNYMGSCELRNGAVGFHVASLELVSLHQDNERGWVRGLTDDGIAATCGAVAEPYLHSFPRPDEFFPLLMTGELTLAEVYWRTTPLVSWQVAMIGDPLYRPFKNNPQLRRADLPDDLKAALRDPQTTRR